MDIGEVSSERVRGGDDIWRCWACGDMAILRVVINSVGRLGACNERHAGMLTQAARDAPNVYGMRYHLDRILQLEYAGI